jgi:hypothetical protein
LETVEWVLSPVNALVENLCPPVIVVLWHATMGKVRNARGKSRDITGGFTNDVIDCVGRSENSKEWLMTVTKCLSRNSCGWNAGTEIHKHRVSGQERFAKLWKKHVGQMSGQPNCALGMTPKAALECECPVAICDQGRWTVIRGKMSRELTKPGASAMCFVEGEPLCHWQLVTIGKDWNQTKDTKLLRKWWRVPAFGKQGNDRKSAGSSASSTAVATLNVELDRMKAQIAVMAQELQNVMRRVGTQPLNATADVGQQLAVRGGKLWTVPGMLAVGAATTIQRLIRARWRMFELRREREQAGLTLFLMGDKDSLAEFLAQDSHEHPDELAKIQMEYAVSVKNDQGWVRCDKNNRKTPIPTMTERVVHGIAPIAADADALGSIRNSTSHAKMAEHKSDLKWHVLYPFHAAIIVGTVKKKFERVCVVTTKHSTVNSHSYGGMK